MCGEPRAEVAGWSGPGGAGGGQCQELFCGREGGDVGEGEVGGFCGVGGGFGGGWG